MLPRSLNGFSPTPTGALRHSVDLLQPNVTGARDAQGNLLGPSVFATVYASIQYLKQREIEKQQHVVGQATHKIVIRYLSGVNQSMLVCFEGRIFQMQSPPIDPGELHAELWLFVNENG